MRLHLVSETTQNPLSGLTAILSKPMDRLPTKAQFKRLPKVQMGETDDKGIVSLSPLGIEGPVQLTIVATSDSGRRKVLDRRTFDTAADVPDRLQVELADPRGGGGTPTREPVRGDTPGGPAVIERPRIEEPGARLPERDLEVLRPERDPEVLLPKRDPEAPRPQRDPQDIRPQGDGPSEEGSTPLRARPPVAVRIPDLGGFAERSNRVTRSAGESLKGGLSDTLERQSRLRRDAGDFATRALARPQGSMREGGTLLRSPEHLQPLVKKQQDDGVARIKAASKHTRGVILRGRAKNAVDGDGRLRLRNLTRALPNTAFTGRISRHSTPKQLVIQENPQLREKAVEEEPPTAESQIMDPSAILDEIAQRVAGLSGKARADSDIVAANLKNPLPSGPADQPAYYDLPVLHVAWKDVWEQAFDDKTVQEIKDLYSSIVEVVPPEALPSGDVAEVTELKDLLGDLGSVVSSATAAIALPNELTGWVDGIGDVWPIMSLNDQEYLRCLYHVQTFCDANYYRVADEMITRDYDSKSGKQDAKEKFYYAFYNSYPNNMARTMAISEYTQGKHAYDYGETVTESNPEDGYLYVAFVRYIERTAQYLEADFPEEFGAYPPSWLPKDSIYAIWDRNIATELAEDFLLQFQPTGDGDDLPSPLGRAEALINGLQNRSDTPYNFDVFARDSYNFGVITTYRQKWQPLDYQAGDLAGTLPLAPNEKRSFSVTRKRTTKESRTESSLSSTLRSNETDEANRAEGEIFRRAETVLSADARIDTHFQGGFLGNGGELNFGGGASADMTNESNQTKKDFREVTRRAAQEYRDERKVEINTSVETSVEISETREISNPNNEISVTYLFYELQRRFEVSERLHDITPVVLVAFAVPKPSDISETWILKHAWILRDVMLDKKLLPVFDTLSQDFVGDEVAVEFLEVQWKTQMAVVSDLRLQVKSHVALREEARSALDRAMQEVINLPDDGNKKEVGTKVAEELFGANEATDAARQALDWAETDLSGADGGLRDAIGALEQATRDYVEAVKTRLNRRHQVDQLILHIKTNILHYMQEIWRREPPGQRYLRIYDIKIAWSDLVEVSEGAGGSRGSLAQVVPITALPTPLDLEDVTTLQISPVELGDTVELHEVADLNQILGFRGNYAAFRLRDPNSITAFMVQDFLDSHFGLFDPDPDGEIPTAQEALEMAQEAWSRPGITERDKAQISAWLVNALEAAHRVSQTIAVPSGELFIEALPGAHPVLEDFKLRHRAVDVAKAEVDVRLAEVELQRRVALLNEGDLGDPDIDRVVRVEGATPTITVDDGS